MSFSEWNDTDGPCQGIEYMHQQNVAHRDITIGNIMMDASELYPEGFHPVRQNLSRNGMAEVVGVMRTHAPVRYYLIDFDSAIAFEKGTPIRYKYAEGKAGRDAEVPEFKLGEPYDPFKVDVFQFGNLLRREFLQVCISFSVHSIGSIYTAIRNTRAWSFWSRWSEK